MKSSLNLPCCFVVCFSGILLQEQKRYKEAIESYLMAIKCRPRLTSKFLIFLFPNTHTPLVKSIVSGSPAGRAGWIDTSSVFTFVGKSVNELKQLCVISRWYITLVWSDTNAFFMSSLGFEEESSEPQKRYSISKVISSGELVLVTPWLTRQLTSGSSFQSCNIHSASGNKLSLKGIRHLKHWSVPAKRHSSYCLSSSDVHRKWILCGDSAVNLLKNWFFVTLICSNPLAGS